MNLSTCTGAEGLRWYLGTRRLLGGGDDIVRALDLGVTDTDLLVRFIRFGRDWPTGCPVTEWDLALAEAYGTGTVVGSFYALEWAALAVDVGHEIAKEAFTADDDKATGAIRDARILHQVLSAHPDLQRATALALRARGVPVEEWHLWEGIDPKKADGSLTLEQARTLVDAGWQGGIIVRHGRYVPGQERESFPEPGRTVLACDAGFTSTHEMGQWSEAILGKSGRHLFSLNTEISAESVDDLIEIRRQVPNKTRLSAYRLLGGINFKRVLDLIEIGCTPDMAKEIVDSLPKPQGYRTRREPMREYEAKHYINRALEARIHAREE